MNAIAEWVRRLRYFVNRDRHDDELRQDIEAHRAMMADPKRFGSPLRLREESRDVWGWRWLDDFGHDIRYAIRSLGVSKAFTATAVITLALGIGATTAIFSVVSALVFRPLPFPDPERLVQIRGTSPLRPATGHRQPGGVPARQHFVRCDRRLRAGARYLRRARQRPNV